MWILTKGKIGEKAGQRFREGKKMHHEQRKWPVSTKDELLRCILILNYSLTTQDD